LGPPRFFFFRLILPLLPPEWKASIRRAGVLLGWRDLRSRLRIMLGGNQRAHKILGRKI